MLIKTSNNIEPRKYWGNIKSPKPELNLIKLQIDSYNTFLSEGIKEVLSEISPVEDFTGKNWELEFGQLEFNKPKRSVEEAVEKGATYEASLKVETILTNKQTNQKLKQVVFLGDIPQMTNNGTFIINGVERVIVSQIVRSPGVFFSAVDDPITGKRLFQGELRPYRGSWLEFATSRTGIITVKIDRRRKFNVATLLKALGFGSSEQIAVIFADVSKEENNLMDLTLAKDTMETQDEALLEIFRKMRPGDPVTIDSAKGLLEGMFFNARRYNLTKVGRFKINKKLNLNIPNTAENYVLTKEDIISTIKYLIGLNNGQGSLDDIDHLANRRVRSVGELVEQNAFRTGVLRLERVIKERMSLIALDQKVIPGELINAKPIIASVNEFFRTSQLSSILDQINPLSMLDNLRKLSVMGVGGITRDRASFSIRDINHSQYGRICPIRSPEGANIGLVTFLALYSQINEYGFIETPYKKVILQNNKPKITDEIIYLSADDEEEFFITDANIKVDKNNFITSDSVPVRKNGNFFETSPKNVNFVDISPQQIVGTSASLIPFLAHDDAVRALMGTHMQCQAVPLLLPEAPIVGTGMEKIVASNMSKLLLAPDDGIITYVDADKVILKTKKETLEYKVDKFVNTPQGTCFNQHPTVSVNQKVKKGDLLIDGATADGGELALGQNLIIAYMSFEGLGYEDAIVISERLIKQDLLSSIHIEEYEVDVVETKLGPDELSRDISNVPEEALANLDEKGIIRIGAEVGPNDILVGKVQPKGETELTAEERLLRAIFGEKAKEVRDTSLRMPHGERGTVIGIQILSREEGDELEAGTLMKIKVKVAQLRKITAGDKLAGRHGNKGVISKIVPEIDMPYLSTGEKVDIIISPLSVISRMNLGQILEAHFGLAASRLNYKVATPVFEKVPEEVLIEELQKAKLPADGKCMLIDGRTGEYFSSPIMIGNAYIMKLIHMVEDKTHARSTGPYSMVTQQPLGGKAQLGGQRLGEMEVWALEAYGAANILQEMLTIKSDDVVGRAKAFEAIVKGTDIPQALVPESFKVLIKELQALSLSVDTLGTKIISIKPEEETEEVKKQVAEMQQVLEATELVEPTSSSGPFEIIEGDING